MANLPYSGAQQRGSGNGHTRPPGNGTLAGTFDGGRSGSETDLRHYAMRDDDRETTRYLSAATQISTAYARLVVSRILHEPYRALPPAHGADVEVVTRWAIDSLRRKTWRDVLLTGTLFFGIASCWMLYVMAPHPMWILVVIVITLALAFIVVAREHWVRQYDILAGKMLRSNFKPSNAPTPSDPEVQGRLRKATDRRNGNVVIFREGTAFKGSGDLLAREQIVVDVSRGKKDDDDNEMKLVPFDNSDIHDAILKGIRKLTPELKDVRAEKRIFVNGRHVQGKQELQEDALTSPYPWVGNELLRRAGDQATPDARTYVCAEIHGWQGQLMVTMFVRAVHTDGWLHIEWSFYVLPPISDMYTAVDDLYQVPTLRKLRETCAWSLRRTVRELIRAPFALMRATGLRLKWKLYESHQGYCIANGQLFDYGAMSSIREEACDMWSRRHYFLNRDETMYALLLQCALIRAIQEFLDSHNIDQGEFKAQAKVIIDASYKHYNVRFGGDVSKSNIAIGEDTKASKVKKTGTS